MPKKRKLNSTNPKYKKDNKNEKQYKKVLMKENEKFKMYFLYEINN